MALIAITLGAFAPILLFSPSFVMWDDNAHIAQSIYFSPPTLGAIGEFWRHAYFGLYIPLTYTIWMIVGWAFAAHAPIASAGGAWVPAWPFHILNLLTHLAAVYVVWRLLRKLRVSPSAAAWGAAVFAVHPLQVEPVAWISGFRDVLGGFLLLLSLLLLLESVDRSNLNRRRSIATYFVSTICFLAALLAKPSSAAGPLFAIVLFRFFRDIKWRTILRIVTPWLVLSAACLIVTKILQPAALPTANVSPILRLLVAADALGFYAWKLIVPWPLGIDYGRTPVWVTTAGWRQGLWIIPIVLLGVSPWMTRRARGALLWTVAGLLPVLGLISFNFQSYSTVADRYVYVSMAGISLLVAIAMSKEPKAWPFALLLTAGCAIGGFFQACTWNNTTELFDHAMYVNAGSFVAPATLAAVALDHQDPAIALKQANRSIEQNSNFAPAQLAAGNALRMLGRLSDAEAAYRNATKIAPNDATGWANLSAVLGQEGKTQPGLDAVAVALRLSPDSPDAHVNAGTLLAQDGKTNTAIAEFQRAVALAPANLSARMNLAIIFANANDAENARTQLRALLSFYPEYAPARQMMRQLQGR